MQELDPRLPEGAAAAVLRNAITGVYIDRVRRRADWRLRTAVCGALETPTERNNETQGIQDPHQKFLVALQCNDATLERPN